MPRRTTPLTEAPPEVSAPEVRALRKKLRVSQSAMATMLNVSVELVQAWEAERRVPRGAALRLLDLVRTKPRLVLDAASEPQRVPPEVPEVQAVERRAPHAGRAAKSANQAAHRSAHAPANQSANQSAIQPTASTLPPRRARSAPATGSQAADSLLRGLVSHGVAFVTVGGVAAHLRGAHGTTDDLDIVYDRSPANLERLATFLRGIQTTLRGAPGTIPFAADPRTLAHTAVLALDTKLGPLDLRQRIAGIGDFAATLANSSPVTYAGRQIPTLTLDALIVSKRATGRSKDREEVRALEALR